MKRHEVKNEPQNIEQEISNDEVWIRCAQSVVKNINDRIPYFDIRYSLFDIRYSFFQSFSFNSTEQSWPSAATLNTETRHQKPRTLNLEPYVKSDRAERINNSEIPNPKSKIE